MLDVFIFCVILVLCFNLGFWELLDYIFKSIAKFKRERDSVVRKLLDHKGGANLEKLPCDKCTDGCPKCGGMGYFAVSGPCTEICPEHCIKKIKVNDTFYCLGGRCEPDQDDYDRMHKFISILRS